MNEDNAEEIFTPELVVNYPKSGRRVTIGVSSYTILDGEQDTTTTVHLSPHGLDFHSTKGFADGALLRINVTLPDYWERKKKYVEYRRVDSPNSMMILAKVVRSEDIGKRGKKKLVMVRTVNIDTVDERVLLDYLEDER